MASGAAELFSQFEPSTGARARQGYSISRQRALWYDLISLRLALQPVLEKVNAWGETRGRGEAGGEGGPGGAEGAAPQPPGAEPALVALAALRGLQASLLDLANAVRVASQRPGAEGPRLPPAGTPQELAPSSSSYALAELEAWQRAYGGAGGAGAGAGAAGAAEQPLGAQVSYILTDRARLRRRVLGSGRAGPALSDKEFYAALLRDFVANASGANPQEFLRQLQAARERRAVRKDYQRHMSKNRMINTRKVHRKLVNFVAPLPRPDGEYLRMVRASIFGK